MVLMTDKAHADGMLNGRLVHPGQCAWMPEGNGADMRIGSCTKSRSISMQTTCSWFAIVHGLQVQSLLHISLSGLPTLSWLISN